VFELLLSHPLIARVRRNHALEHATIHVLSQRHRNLRLVGRSTLSGFVLYGNLPTNAVVEAANEALARLRAGQKELAVHPTCGTNFVAGGALAGVGAFAVLSPRRRSLGEWLGRLPLVLLAATVGLILGQRLGAVLQARVTTEARVGELRIVGVVREQRGPVAVHYVRTEG
jgi:hypothetical protein